MIKLGVIGLGHMGGYHASVATTLQSTQLVGVADTKAENLEKIKRPDITKSSDYHDWINKIDAVIIAVPTTMHFDVARDALLAGKHVLIEKPLTSTLKQAEELFALAEQKNLALHVGHVERFNGAIQELKKIINKPLLIEAHRMGPFSPRVAHDSVVLDLMIHDLDLVINLVGKPIKEVHALGTKIYSNNCDIANVQLLFEGGTIANIISSRASQIKRRSMSVHQEQEFINLDFTTQDLAIHRRASSSVQVGQDQLRYKQESLVEHLFVYKDNPLKQEIEFFIGAIKSGKQLRQADEDLLALTTTFDIERKLGLR